MEKSRRRFLKAGGAGAVSISLAGNSAGMEFDGSADAGQETTTTQGGEQGEKPSAEEVPKGGTLVYGMSSKPDTANVLTLGSVYAGVAVYRVYEFGTTLDPLTSEVRPNVFTDWTVQNASGQNAKPDIYFNMRSGLKWNDGTDFTAEDVLFTYRYIMENKPGNWVSAVEPIQKIEEASQSDWDFHIKLNKPIGVWETDILGGVPLLPKHKWEGKNYQQYDPMSANPDNGPVGLGPGRLTKFDPATSMQVVFDNEYYEPLSTLQWVQDHPQLIAGGPFIDQINFKVFGSETAMTQAFLQGGIDTHYGSLKTSKIPQAKQQRGMGLVEGTDSGFSYYAFNLRRKPLDDVSFRQAVAFMYDDYFWVQRLMSGYVWKGDFVQSNGYPVPRPDYQFAGEDQMMTHPATNAFDFRSQQQQSPQPDIEGVRSFLTEGQVIDGSQGTYVGKDYPGSLSDVSASQSESKYNYSFGPVQSQVLRQHDGADQELRVDGKTIPEVMDGEPITLFIDPPKKGPKEAKAIQRWVDNLKSLGIPMQTQALSFNTMTSKVYYQEDFDMYPMGWGGTGPFGSSAYSFFHSDNADDHSKAESEGAQKNTDSFMYNSTGYGLYGGSADDLLSKARTTMDTEQRNKTTARAIEKIYLDEPYILRDYAKFRWPMNTEKFTGHIPDLVDPAYANFGAQVNNLHLNE